MLETVQKVASPCYGILGKVQRVVSPCYGVVEKVLVAQHSYVYEWEPLFLIKADDGTFEEVTLAVSGHITSLEISEGDIVAPDITLALLKDDLLVTGSD